MLKLQRSLTSAEERGDKLEKDLEQQKKLRGVKQSNPAEDHATNKTL